MQKKFDFTLNPQNSNTDNTLKGIMDYLTEELDRKALKENEWDQEKKFMEVLKNFFKN